ncbi:chemotaxis protein CheW [Lutispora sp.]|uniref:chemotaxis protein CheW n=1 Tax=Lutispora sp. TaxID=2828727 RepID=UPI003565C498
MSSRQVVVFKLNSEFYGIDILKVKEICSYAESVPIPNTPEFVEGIINFRGDIIPIINLRKILLLGTKEHDIGTRIIIASEGNKQLGIIVDEVSEVLHISIKDIDTISELTKVKNKRLISGIGKLKDRIIILLDLVELTSDRLNIMEEA